MFDNLNLLLLMLKIIYKNMLYLVLFPQYPIHRFEKICNKLKKKKTNLKNFEFFSSKLIYLLDIKLIIIINIKIYILNKIKLKI